MLPTVHLDKPTPNIHIKVVDVSKHLLTFPLVKMHYIWKETQLQSSPLLRFSVSVSFYFVQKYYDSLNIHRFM